MQNRIRIAMFLHARMTVRVLRHWLHFGNVLKMFILNQQHLCSRGKKKSRPIRNCKSNSIVQLALNLVIISTFVDLF